MHNNNIYPIARIVTFKDTKLAEEHPGGHLKEVMGQFGLMVKGDSFVNPFMKEVWDYDITVAKAAAKLDSKISNLTMCVSQKALKSEADSLNGVTTKQH